MCIKLLIIIIIFVNTLFNRYLRLLLNRYKMMQLVLLLEVNSRNEKIGLNKMNKNYYF